MSLWSSNLVVIALGAGDTPWIALCVTVLALTGMGIAVLFAVHAALTWHAAAGAPVPHAAASPLPH